jgi:hypothetical protein
MRDLVVLFVHLIVTVVRLARPGGLRSGVAESVLVKHQLRILNRGRERAPNLRAADRIIAGLCCRPQKQKSSLSRLLHQVILMMQAAKHRGPHNVVTRGQLVSVVAGRNTILVGLRNSRT